MFKELYVKNLALIDEIRVPFSEGLHVLTGETGAGKSILLGSVNLALGGKYTSDMIRHGAEYGYVELTFVVEKEEQLAWLKEKDIFPEEGMVILSRKLLDKRSVCKINGETVPASLVREVASFLIDIHGQHEHQSLLYKKNHLSILDAYAKDGAELRSKVAREYDEYQSLKKEYDAANTDEKQRNKEIGFLEYEIHEIESANLKEQEDILLEEQYQHMRNGQKIAVNLQDAYSYSGGHNDNASAYLSRAIRYMQDAANYDKQAEMLCAQLIEIDSLLNDFNRELSSYSDSLEFSEEEFYSIESRLNEINHLKSKYGDSIEEILCYREKQKAELEKLQNYDAYLQRLVEQIHCAERNLKESSSQLTSVRTEAARELEKAIIEQLEDLNFAQVEFKITFAQSAEYTAKGTDEITFMISLNPGHPIRPLDEVASGGELSRIMLAIKTVMAEKDEIETLFFDEIDVGISGRTAQKVAEKMALIAKNHQVICISHLAQIAAMADAHYGISKEVQDGEMKTSIRLLSHQEEVQELARILGGAEITDSILQSAAEMKELAERTK